MRKYEVYLPMSEGQEYDFIELEADSMEVKEDGCLFFYAGASSEFRVLAVFKDWSHFVEAIQKDED